MFTPDAITPQQRLRASHQTGVRQIDSARVPVYGLPPSWNGDRATGNTCFETGVTRDANGVTAEIHETVELLHRRGASALRIESSDHVLSIADDDLRELLNPAATCGSMTITVDGRAVAFACARSAERFAARWAGYQAAVTIIGEGWPLGAGLEIVQIRDFTPYHEGRLQMLKQRIGYELRD